jgi:DNA repair protein RadC
MDESYQLGHRKRLRERFLRGGDAAVADYELLELVLFAAAVRRDVKPLAKLLLKKFQTLGGVIKASKVELMAIQGVGEAAVATIKAVEFILHRVLREEFMHKPFAGSLPQVLQYCQATMGHLKKEQFRLLFLDRHNCLVADEVQQQGTIDQTPVYPREVLHRALELGASALILVHNHPSGDPTPSVADIEITRRIQDALRPVNIEVHDHIIIARGKHASFRALNLI